MATKLNELPTMDRASLTQVWETSFGSKPPPSTSQDMMRLIVGWEIQAKSARSDVRALNSAIKNLSLKTGDGRGGSTLPIAKSKTALSAGTRLSREWQGRTYSVDVLDKGYAYDGRLYASLSPIAKAITGSHRSGPHFFGVSR